MHNKHRVLGNKWLSTKNKRHLFGNKRHLFQPRRHPSEGQVVGSTALACRLLGRGEGCCGTTCWREGSSLGGTHRGASHWSSLTTHHIVGTDLVKPTAIVLMGIDIELHGEVLTLLDIELLDTVLAKQTEDAFAWILTWHLDDIFL